MPTTYVQLTNPRFARGTAKRLKGSASGRKNLRTAMKRTSKRGAYAKNKKKAMMIRNAPFKETKSKTSEDLRVDFPSLPDRLELDTAHTEHRFLNPETFFLFKQGLQEHQMIGNSVYAKYLKQKVHIRFPQAAFQTGGNGKIVPLVPQDYRLIWGWIPSPMNLTGATTPAVPNCTHDDINTYINQRVTDYLNEQKDRMRFIPKKASTIRIIGNKRIRPNLSRMSTAPPQTIDSITGADYVIGSIPDVHTSVSWNLMRKVHYEKSSKLVGSEEGLFSNYSWLPFCVFINYDYDNLPDSGNPTDRALYSPAIARNSCLWYTDS
jgi:hypothetical protein